VALTHPYPSVLVAALPVRRRSTSRPPPGAFLTDVLTSFCKALPPSTIPSPEVVERT